MFGQQRAKVTIVHIEIGAHRGDKANGRTGGKTHSMADGT
jgi:hypothetical protein